MSPKAFTALAIATALSIVLAVAAVILRPAPLIPVTRDEPLFAGLLDRANDVAVIEIRAGKETVTLRRDGDRWLLAERGGYPAQGDRARKLAVALAELRIVEPRTDNPDHFARIDVEDPSADNAASKRIMLATADGTPLATAIVGKRAERLYGGTGKGLYVRRGGEERSWLVSGDLDLTGGPLDWVDRQVLDMPRADVATVTVRHKGEPPIMLARPNKETEIFTLADVPANRIADNEKLDQMASVLDSLTLQDVKPTADAPPGQPGSSLRVTSFDGVRIDASWSGTGDDVWMRLAAAPDRPDVDQAVKDRAAKLNESFTPWAYQVSSFVGDQLNAKLANLLAEATKGS